MYKLQPTERFNADLDKLEKANKKLLKKVESLLLDIEQHPRTGTGKVERLKHSKEREVYSRRIDKKHRLVYEILDDDIIVILMTALGHY